MLAASSTVCSRGPKLAFARAAYRASAATSAAVGSRTTVSVVAGMLDSGVTGTTLKLAGLNGPLNLAASVATEVLAYHLYHYECCIIFRIVEIDVGKSSLLAAEEDHLAARGLADEGSTVLLAVVVDVEQFLKCSESHYARESTRI
jgi:hypothetical protein